MNLMDYNNGYNKELEEGTIYFKDDAEIWNTTKLLTLALSYLLSY